MKQVLTWRWKNQPKDADELDHTHSPQKQVWLPPGVNTCDFDLKILKLKHLISLGWCWRWNIKEEGIICSFIIDQLISDIKDEWKSLVWWLFLLQPIRNERELFVKYEYHSYWDCAWISEVEVIPKQSLNPFEDICNEISLLYWTLFLLSSWRFSSQQPTTILRGSSIRTSPPPSRTGAVSVVPATRIHLPRMIPTTWRRGSTDTVSSHNGCRFIA